MNLFDYIFFQIKKLKKLQANNIVFTTFPLFFIILFIYLFIYFYLFLEN